MNPLSLKISNKISRIISSTFREAPEIHDYNWFSNFETSAKVLERFFVDGKSLKGSEA